MIHTSRASFVNTQKPINDQANHQDDELESMFYCNVTDGFVVCKQLQCVILLEGEKRKAPLALRFSQI